MKPFEYGCVVKGEMFCPRPAFEAELKRYMENGQNVVVFGERRIGMTSLIMSAFNQTKGCKLRSRMGIPSRFRPNASRDIR